MRPLDEEFALEALELMLLSRAFDRRALALHRQGAFGVYLEVRGQEAAVVGSCLAVDRERDWIVGQARELPAYLHHGYPLERLAALFMGKPAQARIPDGVKMLPLQIAIGAQIPHAVGLAWGLKLQGADSVVLCYFGEGASSEGDFHEACNLAGLTAAPVVFFLQNNGWAISVPTREQTAAASYASRAHGYGFPGVRVDGNDLAAVYSATGEAVERARAGRGPTLIEAVTYRMGAHNTSDNPSAYMNVDEYERARLTDPIARVERHLATAGLWNRERAAQVQQRIEAGIDAAIAIARALPGPEPDEMFANAYLELPLRAQRQRGSAVR